jgi:diguanylate cyclase (GGDEF)-like protein
LDTNRCTVLVIDDEPLVLQMLGTLLGREFNFLAAHSAEEGAACLANHRVDVVVCDQNLPGESGIAFLEKVHHDWPSIIRILITGHRRLEDAIEAINRGRVHHFLLKPWQPDDLLRELRQAAHTKLLERRTEQLLAQLQELNSQLERRVAERTRELAEANRLLRQQNQILRRMALTDPLTGLPNRRALDQIARKQLRRRNRTKRPMALALIDVDHFKEINSTYLLPGGDHVLRWLAKRLPLTVRASDTVGRWGGEEFMLIAPNLSQDGAWQLAERVRSEVEAAETVYQAQRIRVTVSIGVCSVSEWVESAEYEPVRHTAAAALSEAKQTGRNRVVVWPYQPLPHAAPPPLPNSTPPPFAVE